MGLENTAIEFTTPRLQVRTCFVIMTVMLASPADASTYSYICTEHGRSYTLEIDDERNVLAWKGSKYKLTPHEPGEVCAKFGWRVQKGDTVFDFCTATQGYAGFERDGERIGIECDQTRFNGKPIRR